MTTKMKKMYQLAIADSEFIKKAQNLERDMSLAEFVQGDELMKHLVAVTYWGYCIGIGTAEEVKKKVGE